MSNTLKLLYSLMIMVATIHDFKKKKKEKGHINIIVYKSVISYYI